MRGEDFLWGEIVHYYDHRSQAYIVSRANTFIAVVHGERHCVVLPSTKVESIASRSRSLRRLGRLDKSNAELAPSGTGVILLYRGSIWRYDLATRELRECASLRQCRSVLHGAIAATNEALYFGEYGSNKDRSNVPVWCSQDDGRSWSILRELENVRHIHGIYHDRFTGNLWISSGDLDGECWLIEMAPDGSVIRTHGNGSQLWRAVSLLFDADRVVWGMDSPLERPCLIILDRESGEIVRGREFPGPVWYSKELEDGTYLMQTSVEPCKYPADRSARLYASPNMTDWHEIDAYEKDRWPSGVFKFGVLAFASGAQQLSDFVIFGEALVGLDGRIERKSRLL